MNKIWESIGNYILSNKKSLLIFIGIMTLVAGYFSSRTQMSYELAKILPKDNPNFQIYENFKSKFGEDGSVMVIAIENEELFKPKEFKSWKKLSDTISKLEGIKNVLSIATAPELYIDGDKIKSKKAWEDSLTINQSNLNLFKSKIKKLPIYKEFLYTKDFKVHLMMITLDQKTINDKGRILLVNEIKGIGKNYSGLTGHDLHYSGMPYIRTEMTAQVTKELFMFLGLAILISSIILFYFFRSISVVLFSLLVVVIGILSSLATIVILGYKITLLSGLIPPLIVIIGIPNSIFLLNKYHETFLITNNKEISLFESISKVGRTLFLANLTTAIGFGVFAFTGSALLVEFGIVASVNVMVTFFNSLILIPIIFSYRKNPEEKDLAHFESKKINKILNKIELWIMERRKIIYSIVGIVFILSIYGIYQIKTIGYIVDDLPESNSIYKDLKFIEKNFKGVMPFEISVEANSGKILSSADLLTKIRLVEKEIKNYPEFTKGLSVLTAMSYLNQVIHDGKPQYFRIPGLNDLKKIKSYSGSIAESGTSFNSFVDSSQRFTRISFQMQDAGTVRTKEIFSKLQPKVDSIFLYDVKSGRYLKPENKKAYKAVITGNSVINSLQTEYLEKNLLESTIFAIILICLIMASLFRSWKMTLISTLPSLIPLSITAGLMGYFGIALKPSTILIFSIAFGISSDGTIYFLTRYKDEYLKSNNIKEAVQKTIQQTGVSMFYTVMILFFGFFIFAASDFKGTQALGILLSVTLLMAMICNLILLPAFLMGLSKREYKNLLED
ncbi:MAG: hypothetical protein RIR51_1911 [Bacteroidota bacterium]|jgi:predicted RND superfamily exporter protein